MQDARRAAGDRRRVPPSRDAVARRLGDREPDARLADEARQQPDRVRATADARQGEIGQSTLGSPELDRRLVADAPLQVADDRRVRVRAHRRAEHVVRRFDIRHPVAHRLVDRVLERRRAGRDGAHLRAERMHAQHVRLLALDVLGAHVHDAGQAEQGAGGGRRDAVLAGAGLGDHSGLAEAAREQRLAERVIDLVGAGVGEVLTLEVEAEARRDGAAGGRCGGEIQDPLGEPIGAIERGGPACEATKQLAQLGPETRVVTKRGVCQLQLLEGRHQGLGHIPPAE